MDLPSQYTNFTQFCRLGNVGHGHSYIRQVLILVFSVVYQKLDRAAEASMMSAVYDVMQHPEYIAKGGEVCYCINYVCHCSSLI